jgi:hypothetical protein
MRYRELLDEMKVLMQSFPHLRDSIDRDELPVNFLLRVGRDKAKGPGRKRRRLSAKARAAISGAEGEMGKARI